MNDHGSNLGVLAAHIDIDEEKFEEFKLKYRHLQEEINVALDMSPLDNALDHGFECRSTIYKIILQDSLLSNSSQRKPRHYKIYTLS